MLWRASEDPHLALICLMSQELEFHWGRSGRGTDGREREGRSSFIFCLLAF